MNNFRYELRDSGGHMESGVGILYIIQKFMEVRTVSDVKAIKAEWEDAEFFKSGMSADEIALGVRTCRIAYEANIYEYTTTKIGFSPGPLRAHLSLGRRLLLPRSGSGCVRFDLIMVKESTTLLGATPEQEEQRLFLLLPCYLQVFVVALILVSFISNIICFFPSTAFLYVTTESDLLSTIFLDGAYGIYNTLATLKEHGLWFTYVVIILFSLVFPPLKLLTTITLLTLRMKRSTRRTIFAVLGQLGRWSLLDVYFIVLLQLICANQSHEVVIDSVSYTVDIRVDVGYGAILFHLAIICSIATVSVLEHMDRDSVLGSAEPSCCTCVWKRDADPKAPTTGVAAEERGMAPWQVVGSGWRTLIFWLGLGAFALVLCSFFIHLFTTRNLAEAEALGLQLLLPQEWTLAEGIFGYLIGHGTGGANGLFGVDMVLFTLVTPVLCTSALVVGPMLPSPIGRRSCYRLARELSAWCNLEVFFLAVCVYLTQESNLVAIDLGAGFYCIPAYMALLLAAFPLMHTLVGGRD